MSFKAGAIEAMLTLNSSQFSGGIASAGSLINPLTAALAAAGAAAAGVAALLGAVSIKAIKLAAEAEQAHVAFTTMLGDAQAAKDLMADINAFAASTPFETPELVSASKKLLAFGTAADQIIPTMRTLGDVSAGLGIPVGELAELYGKARVSGRLMAEDVNQLVGRGIPVIQEFAKQFGVAESEVKGLVTSGRINFSHLQTALVNLTGEGGKFGGMMAAQSRTVAGLWSTLSDSVTMSLTRLGQSITKNLDLQGVIGGVTSAFDAMAQTAMPLIEGLLEGLGGAGDMGKRAGEMVMMGAEIMAFAIATALDRLDLLKAGFYGLVTTVVGSFVLITKPVQALTGKILDLLALIPGLGDAAIVAKAAMKDGFGGMDQLATDAAGRMQDSWNRAWSGERTEGVTDFFAAARKRMAEAGKAVPEPIAPLKIVQVETPKELTKTEESLAKLRGEVEMIGQSDGMKKLMEFKAMKGVGAEQIEEYRKLLGEVDQAKLSEKVGEITFNATLTGMDETERKIAEMRRENPLMDDAQANQIREALKGSDLVEQAKKMKEELMTPFEKFEEQIGKLDAMKAEGLLSEEDYQRGVTKAEKERDGKDEKAKKAPALASLIQGGSAASAKYQTELNIMMRGGDKAVEKEHLAVAKATLTAIRDRKPGGDVVMDITGGMV